MKPTINHPQIIAKAEGLLSEKVISQELAKEGADHIVLKVTTESAKRLVVKVGSDAHTDAFVLKKISSLNIKAPKVIAESEIATEQGKFPLVIMTLLEGILLSGVKKNEKPKHIANIVKEVKKVHSIKSPGKGGRVLDVISGRDYSWKESLKRNLTGENKEFNWKEVLSKKRVNRDIVEKTLDFALHELKSLTECSDLRLIHADLNQSNIFIKGKKLIGIIDWSDAKFGDPLFDFARFRMNIIHRMNKKCLNEYSSTLNLTEKQKEIENFYYLVNLLEYVNWFAFDNDQTLLVKQMKLLKNFIS